MQDTGLRVAGPGGGTPRVPSSAGRPGRAGHLRRSGWGLLSHRRGSALTPWLFLAPALVIFATFKFVPITWNVGMFHTHRSMNTANAAVDSAR